MVVCDVFFVEFDCYMIGELVEFVLLFVVLFGICLVVFVCVVLELDEVLVVVELLFKVY